MSHTNQKFKFFSKELLKSRSQTVDKPYELLPLLLRTAYELEAKALVKRSTNWGHGQGRPASGVETGCCFWAAQFGPKALP